MLQTRLLLPLTNTSRPVAPLLDFNSISVKGNLVFSYSGPALNPLFLHSELDLFNLDGLETLSLTY